VFLHCLSNKARSFDQRSLDLVGAVHGLVKGHGFDFSSLSLKLYAKT